MTDSDSAAPPVVTRLQLVEAGGLRLSFADGGDRTLRLTQGELSTIMLWAEQHADTEAEIRRRFVDLSDETRRVAAYLSDPTGSPEPGMTTDEVADAARRLRDEARHLRHEDRQAAVDAWRCVRAVTELWPDPDDLPAVLNVALLGEWRAAIETDPLARSPGAPMTAQVTVTSAPSESS